MPGARGRQEARAHEANAEQHLGVRAGKRRKGAGGVLGRVHGDAGRVKHAAVHTTMKNAMSWATTAPLTVSMRW